MKNIPLVATNYQESAEEVQSLLGSSHDLAELIAQEHRPLSIAIPRLALKEAQAFKSVLSKYAVSGRVFFAHKATNSRSILKYLVGVTGIDVASAGELDDALRAGFSADSIVVTGPKSDYFLQKASQYDDITIVVDSYEELERLSKIKVTGHQNILLRLTRSVLNMRSVTKKSRFGMDNEGLHKSKHLLKVSEHLRLRGVAFHLDSQSIAEKKHAVEVSIEIVQSLQNDGFDQATVLDIGGGFGRTNGLNKDQYEQLKLAHMQRADPGDHKKVEYWNNTPPRELSELSYPVGVQRLAELLAMDAGDSTVGEYMSDSLIELWVEPGTAIAEPAGVFVAEVIELRHVDGDMMVVVDARRDQLEFGGMESMADPIHIAVSSSKDIVRSAEAYIAGHLCLETDFLSYKKIHFETLPQPGDLLVWTSVGAYRMYFNSSRAIGHEVAAQYALINGKIEKDQ